VIAVLRCLATITMCGNCGGVGHNDDDDCPYPKPFIGDED
jgi:hypothetical protein